MRERSFVTATFVSGIVIALLACDPAAAPPDHEPAIAKVWRSRCGACHVRVEPGTHAADSLEEALSRHKKRVRLRDEQWKAMIAFLASPPAVTDADAATEASP